MMRENIAIKNEMQRRSPSLYRRYPSHSNKEALIWFAFYKHAISAEKSSTEMVYPPSFLFTLRIVR